MQAVTLPLRIGTRGSPLARAQTAETVSRLIAAHRELAAEGAIETVVIRTTGDTIVDRPLADLGGKGLFTREIDDALLADAIDLAVHSMKDVPTRVPEGMTLAALLPREDPRDAWFGPPGGLPGLEPGMIVGTASLRRAALIRHHRPDVAVQPLRGNVQTRLAKLEAGQVHATLLAVAGLRRIGLGHLAVEPIPPDMMLPAVAQGAIGVTCRTADGPRLRLLAAIDDPETRIRITAERAMLLALDGSCRTPIGGLAEFVTAGRIRLSGLVARPDGSEIYADTGTAAAADAERLGLELGLGLRSRAPTDLFAWGNG